MTHVWGDSSTRDMGCNTDKKKHCKYVKQLAVIVNVDVPKGILNCKPQDGAPADMISSLCKP